MATQKLIVFLNTNKQKKIKNFKTHPKKCLEVNPTKEMKEFYTENYKNVTEEIKEDPNK